MAQISISRPTVSVKKNRLALALGYFTVAFLFFAAILMHHVLSTTTVLFYAAIFLLFGLISMFAAVKNR